MAALIGRLLCSAEPVSVGGFGQSAHARAAASVCYAGQMEIHRTG